MNKRWAAVFSMQFYLRSHIYALTRRRIPAATFAQDALILNGSSIEMSEVLREIRIGWLYRGFNESILE